MLDSVLEVGHLYHRHGKSGQVSDTPIRLNNLHPRDPRLDRAGSLNSDVRQAWRTVRNRPSL